MKALPACLTCVNSGFLCNICQKKLDKGEITEFELDLSKNLIKLEENQHEEFGFLKDISFYKGIDYFDVLILVVGYKDKLIITQELIDWIKKTYKIDEIILVEKTEKPRSVVESLIAPGKMLSLNQIFLATGDVQFRAVIRKTDKDKILFTKSELEELTLELTEKIIRIEYQ